MLNNLSEISQAILVRNYLRSMVDNGLPVSIFKDKNKNKETESLLRFLDEEIFISSFVILKQMENLKNEKKLPSEFQKVQDVIVISTNNLIESKEDNAQPMNKVESIQDNTDIDKKNKKINKKGSFRRVAGEDE